MKKWKFLILGLLVAVFSVGSLAGPTVIESPDYDVGVEYSYVEKQKVDVDFAVDHQVVVDVGKSNSLDNTIIFENLEKEKINLTAILVPSKFIFKQYLAESYNYLLHLPGNTLEYADCYNSPPIIQKCGRQSKLII